MPCKLDLNPHNKRTIVCLCGSTKFKEEFIQANFDKTKDGEIVLTVGWFSHADPIHTPSPAEKVALDQLHKHKIMISDYVYVLNIGGYIGDSTRSEIEFAGTIGIPVEYHETPGN